MHYANRRRNCITVLRRDNNRRPPMKPNLSRNVNKVTDTRGGKSWKQQPRVETRAEGLLVTQRPAEPQRTLQRAFPAFADHTVGVGACGCVIVDIMLNGCDAAMLESGSAEFTHHSVAENGGCAPL